MAKITKVRKRTRKQISDKLAQIPRSISGKKEFETLFETWTNSFQTKLSAPLIRQILYEAEEGWSHDQASLFKAILEKEPVITAHMQTRRLAVSGLDWNIVGGTNTAKQKEVELILKDAGIAEVIPHLLDAIGFGYAGAAIDWGHSGGYIKEFIRIDPTRWTFKRDGKTKISIGSHIVPITDYPPTQFVFHQYVLKSGIPSTQGLLRTLIWIFFFKQFAFKHRARFLEKFGIPFLVTKMSSDDFANDTVRNQVKNALRNIGADGIALITDKTVLESPPQPAQSENGNFQNWIKYLDQVYTLTILGQLASSDTTGGMSEGQIQENVRYDLKSADAVSLMATINRDIVRPLEWFKYRTNELEFNIEYEPPEDQKEKANLVVSLSGAGYKAKRKWVEDEFGIPLEDMEAATEAPIGAEPAPLPPELGTLTTPQEAPTEETPAEEEPVELTDEPKKKILSLADDPDQRILDLIYRSRLPSDYKTYFQSLSKQAIISEINSLLSPGDLDADLALDLATLKEQLIALEDLPEVQPVRKIETPVMPEGEVFVPPGATPEEIRIASEREYERGRIAKMSPEFKKIYSEVTSTPKANQIY